MEHKGKCTWNGHRLMSSAFFYRVHCISLQHTNFHTKNPRSTISTHAGTEFPAELSKRVYLPCIISPALLLKSATKRIAWLEQSRYYQSGEIALVALDTSFPFINRQRNSYLVHTNAPSVEPSRRPVCRRAPRRRMVTWQLVVLASLGSEEIRGSRGGERRRRW